MSANDAPTDATGVPLTIATELAGRDTRKTREAAYRERAWRIALLGSCVCLHPLTRYETESEHDPACPAHLMIERRKVIDER